MVTVGDLVGLFGENTSDLYIENGEQDYSESMSARGILESFPAESVVSGIRPLFEGSEYIGLVLSIRGV